MNKHGSIHSTITDKIVAALEKGVVPWIKPWKGPNRQTLGLPVRLNGERYRGVNAVSLWTTAAQMGYDALTWMTYKQAESLGAQVRKGEKGSLVVYYGQYTKGTAGGGGEGEGEGEGGDKDGSENRRVGFARGYTVFNARQIDGLPEEYYPPAPTEDVGTGPSTSPSGLSPEAEAKIERFFSAIGGDVRHFGSSAHYNPDIDTITMPPKGCFEDSVAYYCILGHEYIHWTGHVSRLDRLTKGGFGSTSYALEELIAELGAVFLSASLQLPMTKLENQAAYIKHWLNILKNDNRAIFRVASASEKAVALLTERAGVHGDGAGLGAGAGAGV